MTPVNTDYLPAEYCLGRDIHSLIPHRNDCNFNKIIPQNSGICISKRRNGVDSGSYSEKLDLNISLRLPGYCSVFQAEVMAI